MKKKTPLISSKLGWKRKKNGTEKWFVCDVLLTVHLSIILVINQLNAYHFVL